METPEVDVLNVSIVFLGVALMNKSDARQGLAEATRADVVQVETGISINAMGSMPVAPPELTRRYVLNRDRINVETSPTRSSVTKEYVSQSSPSEDFVRLAQVFAIARENTAMQGQQLTAYGYNMTIVFTPEMARPAAAFLGDHLFVSQGLVPEEWGLMGGLGSLYFYDGSRRWTFNIESRPRDDYQSRRFFMSVNVHVEADGLPSDDEVAQSFDEMLHESEEFMRKLLYRGA